MMRGRFTLACVVLVFASVLTQRASADDRVAAAVALWREGRELLQQKRYAEACDRFARSQQLDPSAGALYNLGDCNEKQGKFASAWSAYTDAETLSASKPGATNQQHAKDAHDAAARVLPRLSRLEIVVDDKTPGVTVSRNGRVLEAAALNIALPVDSGSQTITAVAPDRRDWSTTLDLAEGTTATVHVPELETTRKSLALVPGFSAPAKEPRSHVPLGLEIGGGALLATGLVFGGLALAKWSSVTDECKNASCPSEAIRQARSSDHDTASTFATVSTVCIGVGIAALAVGVVLHLTAPSREASPRRE